MKMNYDEIILKAKKTIIRDVPELAWILFTFKVEINTDLPVCAQLDFGKKTISLNPIEIEKFVSHFFTDTYNTNATIELFYQYLIFHELKHIMLKHIQRGQLIRAEPILWNLACDITIEHTNINEGVFLEFSKKMMAVYLNYLPIRPPYTAESIYYQLLSFKDKTYGFLEKHNPVDNFTLTYFKEDNEIEVIAENSFNSYLKTIGKASQDSCDEYLVILTKLNLIKYLQNVVALNLMRNEPVIKIPHRRQIALSIESFWEQIKLFRQRKVLIAVDVSGSITKEEFSVFMSGVYNGVREVSVDLILWDAAIKKEYKDLKEEEILKQKIEFVGRGGTNLNCVMDYLEKNFYTNVIILTDGYCDFEISKWNCLKYKPYVTLFYTEKLTFDVPSSWDIHYVDAKSLMLEAIKLKGGKS